MIISKHQKQWNHDIAYIVGGQSGYYFSIIISENINLEQFQEKLLQKNIYIQRNERSFYDPHHFHSSIRLSLARIQPHDLNKALEMIYQVLIDEYSHSIQN